MGITKNPLVRYKILDKCFRNTGRKYFIDDLIEACSQSVEGYNTRISRRQVLEDINFMESSQGWNIQLERYREGRKVYYRYTDTSYSINNMPLNEIEIIQIQEAVHILNQFNGLPQFEWMSELLTRLKLGIALEKSPQAIMSFDNNQYLQGIDKLGGLFNAIFYSKVLRVIYQDFKSDHSYEMIIHPYYLKQYNNRWFLFGYNPAKNRYDWNLAIDRIIEYSEIPDEYQKNTIINWAEYFEDVIGPTRPENGKPSRIRLFIYGDTCKYVLSKPIHGSQKFKWINDETAEIELSLILNYELERLILSYGNNIKVIEPLVLVDSIQAKLKQAISRYQDI